MEYAQSARFGARNPIFGEIRQVSVPILNKCVVWHPKRKVIRPFELPGTHLPNLLDTSLEERRRMWLQQDSYPAHYAHCVRDYLNETFPRRSIGRSGTILLWVNK